MPLPPASRPNSGQASDAGTSYRGLNDSGLPSHAPLSVYTPTDGFTVRRTCDRPFSKSVGKSAQRFVARNPLAVGAVSVIGLPSHMPV